MAKRRVYMVGECELRPYFPAIEKLSYAFFSGTDSPHRKIAIQIMDQRGHIAGFAKLSTNPAVVGLLQHEAIMLKIVADLHLHSANTPSLIYCGPQKDATVLVTDTLKTPWTRSITRFTPSHAAFLAELADKTRQPPQTAGIFAEQFHSRLEPLLPRLDASWQNRLNQALGRLEEQSDLLIPCCMSHGDFTPWNTFMAQGKLYVFDWEYAQRSASKADDLIHFVLNQPRLRNFSVGKQVQQVWKALGAPWVDFSTRMQYAALLIYLFGQVLRQLDRMPQANTMVADWDGMTRQAAIFDQLSNEEAE